MKNILVLCTGNSCRSQIADGYLKHFAQGKANVYSAGVETHGVNPRAIAVMKEDGIDISQNTSNNVDEYLDIDFDFVESKGVVVVAAVPFCFATTCLCSLLEKPHLHTLNDAATTSIL